MDGLSNVFLQFTTPKLNEGDFINDDGLLICGRCGEPKQFYGDLFTGDTVKINCPCKCDRERDEAIRKRQCQENIAANRISAFPEGSSYINARFENADETLTIIRSQKYTDNFKDTFFPDGTGLLYYGNVGTGKTYTAACICNAVIDLGYNAVFTTIPRIINRVQSSFDGRQEYIDHLCNVPLLVIDDLTAERNSEFAKEITFQIIDGRCSSKKPLIATTNLTLDEIKGKGADIATARILSRLLEMCVPVEITGEDRRRGSCRVNYNKAKAILDL